MLSALGVEIRLGVLRFRSARCALNLQEAAETISNAEDAARAERSLNKAARSALKSVSASSASAA